MKRKFLICVAGLIDVLDEIVSETRKRQEEFFDMFRKKQ